MAEWETFYTEETIEAFQRKYRKKNTVYSVVTAIFSIGIGFVADLLPSVSDAITFVDKNEMFHFIGRMNEGFWTMAITLLVLATGGLLHLFFKKRYAKAYEEFNVARTGKNIKNSIWSKLLIAAAIVVVFGVFILRGRDLTHITLEAEKITISCRSNNKSENLIYQADEISEIMVLEYNGKTDLELFTVSGDRKIVRLGKTNQSVEVLLRAWDGITEGRFRLTEQQEKNGE